MSIKEATEKVKAQVKGIREEVKGTVDVISKIPPRPLKNRRTILLRKPLIDLLLERHERRRE